MLTLKKFICSGGLFLFLSCLFAEIPALKPSGFVNDYAGILSSREKEELENMVESIEEETSAEIAILLIDSLEGNSVEEYAAELFNSWGIGKKDKNNGVLILASLQERRIRIEVGYGLEPVLPDGLCGRIIRERIAPSFREGNYHKGLALGVDSIARAVKGEPSSLPRAPSGKNGKEGLFFFILIWNAFLLFFSFGLFHKTGVLIFLSALALFGSISLFSGKGIDSPETAALLVFIPFFLVFFMGMFAPVIFAVIRWRLKKKYKSRWKEYLPKHMKKAMSYSGSRGSFSSGGSSGGGFGGGSSGGGGASGGW